MKPETPKGHRVKHRKGEILRRTHENGFGLIVIHRAEKKPAGAKIGEIIGGFVVFVIFVAYICTE